MEPLLLSCIESRVENSRSFYGRFQLGPFVSGQGVTIANSLRRSLLSEISGLAITAIEIEGAAHEYSTVAGIRESVLDILLNVKQIVLTSDFEFQEPQVAFLQVQGPGIVRANDIKLPISIQSVDPEQYIATLLYDGTLKMKFLICRGKNYLVQTPHGLKIPNKGPASTEALVYFTKSSEPLKQDYRAKIYNDMSQSDSTSSAEVLLKENKTDSLTKKNLFLRKKSNSGSEEPESINASLSLLPNNNKNDSFVKDLSEVGKAQNKKFKKTSNVLPIDAVFMPINRVNFAIESNDLSEAPKDRVILEIWTNGSIHPKQAINEAAKALIQLIAPFQETKLFKSIFLNSTNVLQKVLSSSKTKKNLKVMHLKQSLKSINPTGVMHSPNKVTSPSNIAYPLKGDVTLLEGDVRAIDSPDIAYPLKGDVRAMPHPLLNKNIASLDIGNLDLTLRPYTCLKRAKIETVADLLQYSSEDLLNLKNFGKHSLNEVENNLNQMGLKLRSQKIK